MNKTKIPNHFHKMEAKCDVFVFPLLQMLFRSRGIIAYVGLHSFVDKNNFSPEQSP
jgi:hypothetical protein